jgi:hypothetical protein
VTNWGFLRIHQIINNSLLFGYWNLHIGYYLVIGAWLLIISLFVVIEPSWRRIIKNGFRVRGALCGEQLAFSSF